MSLKIVPMTPDDYYALGSEINDGCVPDGGYLTIGLSDTRVFGSDAYSPGEDRPVCRDHMRGYIRLALPIVNPIITQSDVQQCAKLLGVETADMAEVLEFRAYLDPRTGEVIPLKRDRLEGSLLVITNYLWGAEALRYWIDNLDIEKEIQQTLHKILGGYHKLTKCPTVGEFSQDAANGYLIADTWYFHPEVADPIYEGLTTYVGTVVFASKSSRLAYLLRLQGHKERLYSMIMEYIAVVPLGMRPDVDSHRHDQLTMAYDEVISANKNLRMVLSGMPDPDMFAHRYKTLNDRVYNLLVRHIEYRPTRRSVLEKLQGKTGHVRSKMLGKRVDYSARSVITIDPYLSLRKIKLPKNIAPKLYRYHILHSMGNPNPSDWIGTNKQDKCNNRIVALDLLKKVPLVIGRQPTLHKLSMRAFDVELTDERSLVVNPLCVPGFNADFDGDQMHGRVPISDEAVREVNELLRIEQNIYTPKNGECSVMPRQDIIYGLNVCTRSTLQKGVVKRSYANREQLFEDLFGQLIGVGDTVSLNGYTECAGRVAFAACLPESTFKKIGMREITTKNIGLYVNDMLALSVGKAIDYIDDMVKLGFKIGYLHPATLNLLDGEGVSYASEMEAFHKAIADTSALYERGLEEESTYNAVYDQEFRVVEEHVKETLYSKVGAESGFVRLAESGARGSKSNLLQMYGYKGRIQKSAREAFKAVIEHSYTDQLTPLEHFVTAYGGQQGLITKSLSSAETGYEMRKMWHAASPFTVIDEDCGTTEGIRIVKADITSHGDTVEETDAIFKNIIRGRYEAGTNTYITAEVAEAMCASRDAVTIRSVLTCNNPCCRRCYGIDPSSHRLAAMGLPIGLIAAQSIGEPGTQLSMDSFKKGGIATTGGVTSAFDKLDAYVECRQLSKRTDFGTYDPVAWASGPVREVYIPNGMKRVYIGDSKASKQVPAEAVLRKEAVKGEGLCLTRGDYDITELLENTDIRTAQLYLIHTLYHIYKEDGEINMKHFEVLVASMTMHMVISTDREDLIVGQYHDDIQMHKGSLANTVYVTTLKGIKSVPLLRTHALSRILMENVKAGLASSVLLGLEDPLEYPLNRIAMGLEVTCGNVFSEFIEERRIPQ